CTVQSSEMAAAMAASTAAAFSTGRAPGRPRHTGHVWVFGRAPKAVLQPQKIFVRVDNCACTSRPMTASKDSDVGGGDEDAGDTAPIVAAASRRSTPGAHASPPGAQPLVDDDRCGMRRNDVTSSGSN